MSAVSREHLQRVYEVAVEECRRRLRAVADELTAPDGLAYGDESLNGPDFVRQFIWLQQQGAFDFLPTLNPELYQRMRARYLRELVQLRAAA